MKRSSNCSCNNITIFLLQLLWDYYNSNTVRSRSGRAIDFRARARILDGRKAIYTGQAPVVASYSSRGPDVNNVLFETADVLKPNIIAPGSSIWAAWSPKSEGDKFIKGIDANILVILWTNMCVEAERFNLCCKLLFCCSKLVLSFKPLFFFQVKILLYCLEQAWLHRILLLLQL